MKKYTKLLKTSLILLLIGILGFFLFIKVDNNKTKNNTVQVQNLETTLGIKNASDFSPADVSGFIGKTALEATYASAKEIKTNGTGVNAYITSLNGRAAEAKKNEFWELTINGKSSDVGAGSYIIKAGDKIVWQINTF